MFKVILLSMSSDDEFDSRPNIEPFSGPSVVPYLFEPLARPPEREHRSQTSRIRDRSCSRQQSTTSTVEPAASGLEWYLLKHFYS